MKWRSIESAIKDPTKDSDRMLVKDQNGRVVIATYSGFHKAWMFEGDHIAAGAKPVACQRLPK